LKKVKADPVEAAKIHHIVINQIYGGMVFIGKALQAVGIPEGEVGELSSVIQEDGKTMGQRVQGWIGRNADMDCRSVRRWERQYSWYT
jgi:hypothetical protein